MKGTSNASANRSQLTVVPLYQNQSGPNRNTNLIPILIIGGSIVMGFLVLIVVGICIFKFVRKKKTSAADYSEYGGKHESSMVHGSDIHRSTSLAYSAQRYHFEYKKRLMALEKASAEQQSDNEDHDPFDRDENEHGDYMVYECAGLASTEDVEVKNPLYSEGSSPRLFNNGDDDQDLNLETLEGGDSPVKSGEGSPTIHASSDTHLIRSIQDTTSSPSLVNPKPLSAIIHDTRPK